MRLDDALSDEERVELGGLKEDNALEMSRRYEAGVEVSGIHELSVTTMLETVLEALGARDTAQLRHERLLRQILDASREQADEMILQAAELRWRMGEGPAPASALEVPGA